MDNQWSNSRFYHSETAVNFGTPGNELKDENIGNS